jgi:hypothetical protein
VTYDDDNSVVDAEAGPSHTHILSLMDRQHIGSPDAIFMHAGPRPFPMSTEMLRSIGRGLSAEVRDSETTEGERGNGDNHDV